LRKQMRNRALLRRLAKIEAKSEQVARAIAFECPFAEDAYISPEEVEKAYRRLWARPERTFGPDTVEHAKLSSFFAR
jgi:hypothetical protein